MVNVNVAAWPPPGPLIAIVVSVLVLLTGAIPVLAQPAPDGTPGPGQVIAQGTTWLPPEPVIWWIGQHNLPEADPLPAFGRNLGFVLGGSGTTTTVTDGVFGEQLIWLEAGEGLFVPRDISQERYTEGSPASYLSLDLVPVAASLPAPAEPFGDAFTPVAGLQEMQLRRDVLAPGQTAAIPTPDYPVLVLATAGALEIRLDDGERFQLLEGDATTIDLGGTVTAISRDPATLVLADITTRVVDAPATANARVAADDLGIWVLACPPGVTARPDMTTAGCEFVDPLASGAEVAISSPALAAPLTLANSEFGDAGARLWPNVPFGTYTLTATLPPGAIGYAVRPVSSNFPVTLLPDGSGYTFTIEAGQFDPGSDYWRQNLELYLLYP